MENEDFEALIKDEKILKAIDKLGYSRPSKVQSKVMPLMHAHKDIIVQSQTGSGKTAAFGIPLCETIDVEMRTPQVLILAPTRELAVQIKQDIENIGLYKSIHCVAVFGKQPISFQTKELKQRVHIVAGTPGRTLDHIKKGSLYVEDIKYLVIDEADEMLNMGFIDEVSDIIRRLPKNRITTLFSATMPEEIEKLCASYMVKPERISITPDKVTVENIEQKCVATDVSSKLLTLETVLYLENPDNCIIFCNTKATVDKIYDRFNSLKWPAIKLHGDMLQNDRLKTINNFKAGKARFLIATDIAARGLDIESLSCIINYDMPVEKERYVHRIGRTGRAGKKGTAITFVTSYDERMLSEIEEYIDYKFEPTSIELENISEEYKARFAAKNVVKAKNTTSSKIGKDVMKIHLNLGKDKKIRPGDIAGAISNIDGVNGEDIGIIEIWDRFSNVTILNGKGSIVLNNLKKLKGKNVKAAVADK
ncbi:DEAD/DEAH box helicase [Clostridium oryzae]|uniref:ATP-dependent RNA helicase DbpA n=1 Tax=Clostridium oryzae TaxID=1450648 RepID=A0A1V4IQU5_9CLOT|nr:DEAD/DEAH box helicase [Clostridium oryzae]OPJ62398.1 ATP-dependent RNA helicase DbpA [Clostridium oryzae]